MPGVRILSGAPSGGDPLRDELYMRIALYMAQKAYLKEEVPIGALAVYEDEIIAWAHNEKEKHQDSTAHAEILVMQRASKYLKRWRLTGVTIYSTLEPCPMCAGAMINTRISRLVYGSKDPKAGAAGSVVNLLNNTKFNHQVEIKQGILQEECAQILSAFFSDLRRDGRVGRRRSTRNRVDR